MPGFTVHTGRLAAYLEDHVDTDRIIPARFLSRVSREGYGDLLFADARQQSNQSFPLDQPEAKNATILLVGTNFGCGSSREHAVWAIQQAGYQAVIARVEPDSPGYSDIFRQNAANCGLLLVELPPMPHATLAQAGSGTEITIDLPAQTIALGLETFAFDIHPATKNQLVQGLDLIGTTLVYDPDIARFESEWTSFAPPPANR